MTNHKKEELRQLWISRLADLGDSGMTQDECCGICTIRPPENVPGSSPISIRFSEWNVNTLSDSFYKVCIGCFLGYWPWQFMLICTTDYHGNGVSRALAAGCNAALADSLAKEPKDFTIFGHFETSC